MGLATSYRQGNYYNITMMKNRNGQQCGVCNKWLRSMSSHVLSLRHKENVRLLNIRNKLLFGENVRII